MLGQCFPASWNIVAKILILHLNPAFQKKNEKEVLEAKPISPQHTYLDARLAAATTCPVQTELNFKADWETIEI